MKQTKAQWRFDEIMWWKPRIIKPMESKQTAIEWLENILHDFIHPEHGAEFASYIEQAKAMEKEQIIEAHEQAYIKMNLAFRSADRAEDYYNETYKK